MAQALSQADFNQQVQKLFDVHGAAAFAAPAGQSPQYTVFVDGETVVAEGSASPRHRYGTFCELSRLLANDALVAYVQKWLERGEAYNLYLSMNVCRYSC